MDGRGRAPKIVNLVDFNVEGVCDIVSKQLEVPMVEQVLDIPAGPGVEIIDTQHLISPRE